MVHSAGACVAGDAGELGVEVIDVLPACKLAVDYLPVCDSDVLLIDFVLVCEVEVNVQVQVVRRVLLGNRSFFLPVALRQLPHVVDHVLHFSFLLYVLFKVLNLGVLLRDLLLHRLDLLHHDHGLLLLILDLLLQLVVVLNQLLDLLVGLGASLHLLQLVDYLLHLHNLAVGRV